MFCTTLLQGNLGGVDTGGIRKKIGNGVVIGFDSFGGGTSPFPEAGCYHVGRVIMVILEGANGGHSRFEIHLSFSCKKEGGSREKLD